MLILQFVFPSFDKVNFSPIFFFFFFSERLYRYESGEWPGFVFAVYRENCVNVRRLLTMDFYILIVYPDLYIHFFTVADTLTNSQCCR